MVSVANAFNQHQSIEIFEYLSLSPELLTEVCVYAVRLIGCFGSHLAMREIHTADVMQAEVGADEMEFC